MYQDFNDENMNDNYEYNGPTYNGPTYKGPVYSKPLNDGKGQAILSMVLGLTALLLFFSFLNVPLALVAIIMGIASLVKHKTRHLLFALTGIVTAALSLIIMFYSWSMVFANTDRVLQFYNDTQGIQEFEIDLDDIGGQEYQDL